MPSRAGELLDRGLQEERAVGGVEGAGVLDVDLVLRVHELVVRGEHAQAERLAGVEHLEHDPPRVEIDPTV